MTTLKCVVRLFLGRHLCAGSPPFGHGLPQFSWRRIADHCKVFIPPFIGVLLSLFVVIFNVVFEVSLWLQCG
jgi:hypothetical protein